MSTGGCDYCIETRGDERMACASWSPRTDGKEGFDSDLQYLCTREKGHSGDHVACGLGGEHVIGRWANRKQGV